MISRDTETEVKKLYERYASMVFNRCRMFLKSEDDSWDATQEVFMKLIRALPSIEKKESIYSWLLSTSTNFCISQLRKKRHEEFNEEFHLGESADKMLPQERKMLMNEIVKHYIAPWDEKTRLVIIYTYIDGYKQDEIAKLTGMGESTIRRYLTKFRRECGSVALHREDLV